MNPLPSPHLIRKVITMENDPPSVSSKDSAKTLVHRVKRLSNSLLHPVGVNMNVYTLFTSTARKLLKVAGEEWLSPWYTLAAQSFTETSQKDDPPFAFAAYGSINLDEIPLAPYYGQMTCSKKYCHGLCTRPTWYRINDTQVTRFKDIHRDRPALRRINKGDRIGRLERKSKPDILKPIPRLSRRNIRPPLPVEPIPSLEALITGDESSLKRPREDNTQQYPSKKIRLSATTLKGGTKAKGKKRCRDNYEEDSGVSVSPPPNKKARISTPVGSHAQWHTKMSNLASPIPQTESRRRLKRRNRSYIAPRPVPFLELPLSAEHQTWNPIPETMIGAKSYNRVIRGFPNSRTVYVLEYLCNLPRTSSPRSTGPSCLVYVDTA